MDKLIVESVLKKKIHLAFVWANCSSHAVDVLLPGFALDKLVVEAWKTPSLVDLRGI